tara:strand:+ start:749 stop:1462 length:714 start_codon:yes stop_codon:yes gene_type:complete
MKILVISPTYNESKNISNLIDELFKLDISLDLLIVDDNSPDGTSDIVKTHMRENKNIHIIQREKKMGLGTAYIAGYKYAIENNYDIIVQIDADLSHDPKDINSFIEHIGKYDMIIGSRYVDGVNVVNWPIRRLLLSYFANFYARLVTGVPIYDLTGGFKCIKSKVLEKINLDLIQSQGYSFQIEINFLTFNYGFAIKEIPIIFHDRTVGESKMNRSIVYEAMLVVPKLFFKKLFFKK